MKIGVARADLPDTVFAHQDRRVRIVNEIARELGHLGNHFAGDIFVTGRRRKHAESWRGQERLTNPHADCMRQGRRITRGCVGTGRNW